MRAIAFLAALALMCGAAVAQTIDTSAGPARLEKMADGLDTPWAIGLLPGGGVLVTERGGRLMLFEGGQGREVAGLPAVFVRGEGGLMDVTVARDFEETREIFLTYAHPYGQGGATALAVARLAEDGTRLEEFRRIFTAEPSSASGRHFGSRVVEARDGTLFLTLGDRGDDDSAQDLARHDGSVLRVNRDGSAPADNPYLKTEGARPEIWSIGHRNMQGAALDLSGALVVVEHGARGGDEVNRIRKGANYGWPVISYGRRYSGAKIGEGTEKEGMEQPALYWDPSIAPSGLLVYSGRLWPDWRGHLFTGSLKFGHIARLAGKPLRAEERIEGPETARLRDLAEDAEGAIWFLSEAGGTVWRMTPGD